MALNFRITEEYCSLALELEQAGYSWQPRPGDWMLDRDDGSIGLLTRPVSDVVRMRLLNTHLPTYVQVSAMLDELGVITVKLGNQVEFRNSRGVILLKLPCDQFALDESLYRLKALIVAYRSIA